MTGTGSFNDSVLYTLSGNHDGGGTTLHETGLLTIGENEYSPTITVTAISRQDNEFSQTATIAVSDFLSKLSMELVTNNWLYNNEDLPLVPNFADKPYLLICIPEGKSVYRVWASAEPFYITTVDGHTGAYGSGAYARALCNVGDAAWRDVNEEYGSNKLIYWETDLMRLCWANHDILDKTNGDSVCLSASDPVPQCVVTSTDSGTVYQINGSTVNFDAACTQLNTTDTVYTVKVWLYKMADGLDTTMPETYTSEAFGGSDWAQRITLTDFEPYTEYGVYGVICVDGVGTDHNAVATFTTLEGEQTAAIAFTAENVTGVGFTAVIDVTGLDSETAYTAEVNVHDAASSIVAADEVFEFTGDSTITHKFAGLDVNTEYEVSVDVYPSPAGAVIVRGDYIVTTTDVIPASFDRDSFLLGMASGLGCTAVTKADVYADSWMQGFIVGDALRKAVIV